MDLHKYVQTAIFVDFKCSIVHCAYFLLLSLAQVEEAHKSLFIWYTAQSTL